MIYCCCKRPIVCQWKRGVQKFCLKNIAFKDQRNVSRTAAVGEMFDLYFFWLQAAQFVFSPCKLSTH